MSGLGRWSLGIGLGLVALSVALLVLSGVPATVIIGILGLVGVGMAAYDAIYEALGRAELRRRARSDRHES